MNIFKSPYYGLGADGGQTLSDGGDFVLGDGYSQNDGERDTNRNCIFHGMTPSCEKVPACPADPQVKAFYYQTQREKKADTLGNPLVGMIKKLTIN